MKFIVGVFYFLLLSICCTAQNVGWNPLEAGSYQVGYTQIVLPSENGVPMVASIWYPAKEGAKKMTFEDFIKSENLFNNSEEELLSNFNQGLGFFYKVMFPMDSIHLLGSTQTRSYRDAVPEKGAFPLVLGMGSSFFYFTTYEYLASHGRIVATISCGFKDEPPSPDGPYHYNRFTDAMEKLLVLMTSYPSANAEDITVIGHGFAINPAMYLAMRNGKIKRAINLDGGFFGPRSKSQNSSDYHPEKFKGPILYIVTGDQLAQDDPNQRMKFASSLIEAKINSPVFKHRDFTSFGRFVQLAQLDINAVKKNKAFVSMHRLILDFLDAKKKPASNEEFTVSR
jgi:hypothetical protein